MAKELDEMSYRDLQIWQLARELSIEVHRMTLEKLPKFEAYEEAAQIRRSMKSVRSNIVEGYGRRRYKQDFIRFIVSGIWHPATRLHNDRPSSDT
jgi:hypothetical protein